MFIPSNTLAMAALMLATFTNSVGAFDRADGCQSAVVALGDTNADGVPDFAIAHRGSPITRASASPAEIDKMLAADWPFLVQEDLVWILSGKDGTVLHTLRGGPGFGSQLICAGDLDGDGVLDLATSEVVASVALDVEEPGPGSAAEGEAQGALDERRVCLISGATGASLGTLAAPPGSRNFGVGLSGGLQAVGDKTPDLLIGSDECVWLVDGATRRPRIAYVQRESGVALRLQVADWSLGDLASILGLRLVDESSTCRMHDLAFGRVVKLLPDADGDGLAEVALVSCVYLPSLGPGSEPEIKETPRTQILFSRLGHAPLTLPAAPWNLVGGHDLDGDGHPDIVTAQENQYLRAWSRGKLLWQKSFIGGKYNGEGTSLVPTADCDGDGVTDFVFAANETGFDADWGFLATYSGRTGEVILKSDDFLRPARGQKQPYEPGGLDAAPIGDLTGNGFDEIAIWLPVNREIQLLEGRFHDTLWTIQIESLPRSKPRER